ncbi:MAG: cytochrome c oxidase subunit II [Gemmatimonadaceae bacterium]
MRTARPRRRARARTRVGLAGVALLAVSCTPQSTVWGAGEGADRIATLNWFLIVASTVVFGVVVAIMLAALFHNHRHATREVDLSPRSLGWVVFGGAVFPAAILIVVFVVGLHIMSRFPTPVADHQLGIRVTAHQWWWQIEYDVPATHQSFMTANELHVPVGVPVRVLLMSADVIHSFWVPRLQGKLDVIPGDTNDIRLLAREPGIYRGQCAEFCGLQHAHMGIVVVADQPADFAAWMAKQTAPSTSPRDSVGRLGQHEFETGVCAACHTVRGTSAAGAVGPDLTHVGSRTTIGAGLLPNTLASIEGWIANPQALKPGIIMPPNTQFNGAELLALATYISSLK